MLSRLLLPDIEKVPDHCEHRSIIPAIPVSDYRKWSVKTNSIALYNCLTCSPASKLPNLK